jgi:hypothetical protein
VNVETCYVNERYGSPMKPRILPVSADQVYGKFESPKIEEVLRHATPLRCATVCYGAREIRKSRAGSIAVGQGLDLLQGLECLFWGSVVEAGADEA